MSGYRFSRTKKDKSWDELTKDVAFNRRSFGMEDTNTSPYDNAMVQVGTDGLEVRLIQGIDESSMAKVLAACEQATIGLEIADIDEITGRPDETNEMFSGGLQSALETQVLVFAVRGASRTCTHQLVRSRRASFHQQSQRASFMGEYPEVRIPESIWNAPARVFTSWLGAINAAHAAYRTAVEADISYQDARFILPEGTTTFIMCEYSVREFMAVYEYRACSMFSWEIVRVMRMMKDVLVQAHPWIEPYIKITCEKTKGSKDALTYRPYAEQREDTTANGKLQHPDAHKHTCRFQGWEQIDEQCDFPWARETNREYRSEKKSIGKK